MASSTWGCDAYLSRDAPGACGPVIDDVVLCEQNAATYAIVDSVATLHLRNVPPEVDAALAEAARAHGMSKNRRAIEALRRGLGLDQLERSRLIEEIRDRRRTVDLDVAGLIRRDRPD